jgi:hypothetical protein
VLEYINPFGWKVNKKIFQPRLICYSFSGSDPLSQVVAFLTGFSRIAPEKPEINNLFLLNLVLRGPNRNRQYSILAGLDANRLIVSLTVQKGFSLQNPTCWY